MALGYETKEQLLGFINSPARRLKILILQTGYQTNTSSISCPLTAGRYLGHFPTQGTYHTKFMQTERSKRGSFLLVCHCLLDPSRPAKFTKSSIENHIEQPMCPWLHQSLEGGEHAIHNLLEPLTIFSTQLCMIIP